MPVLAGDIGGTKTLLGLQLRAGQPMTIQAYGNAAFAGLEAILADYLQGGSGAGIDLVLAVAGPVEQGRCQMTNLPWLIESAALQRRFCFKSVHLLNDMEATGWAMPLLSTQGALTSLRGSTPDFRRPVAVMSVGTGLGEAVIIPQDKKGWRVLPSEGGHKQFAPFNTQSAALLQQAYLTGQSAVSWENWFSGSGLPHLFQALFPDMQAPDSATISQLAHTSPASPEGQCMTLFAQGLLAEAGNLALQYLAWGGVIFAGGVAQHVQAYLGDANVQQYLARKADHVAQLQQVPLALCSDTEAALKGAAEFYWHQQIRGS